MWELFALVVYSLQWLGVVLGVGAEAVLLVAHLSARHHHRPDWLDNVPAVRTVQKLGLLVIIVSGAAAVLYQVFNDASVLAIPTFGFKWLLIALCAGMFWLEGYRTSAWLEGLAGATWLALFVLHSVAPIFMWVDLAFFYTVWLGVFMGLWGLAVWVMGAPAKRAYDKEDDVEEHVPLRAQAPVRPKAAPMPVASRPVVRQAPPPPPVPVVKTALPPRPSAPPRMPMNVPEEELAHEVPHLSLWQRMMHWFGGEQHAEEVAVSAAPLPPIVEAPPSPPPPPMARASAPLPPMNTATIPSAPVMPKAPVPPLAPPAPKPISASNLPVVEHRQLAAPVAASMPPPPPPPSPQAIPPLDPGYVPDYANIPGVRVMPQRPEDLAHESRAPLVQPA